MRKNNIKLLCIELLGIVLLLIDILSGKVYNQYIYVAFWLAMLVITILLVGFEKDKNVHRVDLLQQVFIYSISYLIFTYIIGIFVGFLRTGYSLEPLKIIKNIFYPLIVIVIEELLRYVIASKGKENRLNLILIVILFSIYTLIFGIRTYGTSSIEGIVSLVGLVFLPAIAKNVLLTYVTLKGGYKPTILYCVITEITIYLLPVFPNFGDYIKSILNFIVPMIMFLLFFRKYTKQKKELIEKIKKKKIIINSLLTIILVTIIVLTSGVAKIYSLAVGSASMTPNLLVGDVVIIQKLSQKEMKSLKEDDILAHLHDGKIIVHRIIEIDETEEGLLFQTKGDYNDNKDFYKVDEKNVRGIVIFRIPYIGLPSVWLSRLFV